VNRTSLPLDLSKTGDRGGGADNHGYAWSFTLNQEGLGRGFGANHRISAGRG